MIPNILDKKIKIITNEESVGAFSNKTTQKVIKTLYANMLTLSNSEVIQDYSKEENVIISFRVIYSNFTKELPYRTKEYQIIYNNLIYDIITAIPKNNSYIDIKCKVTI